ncbi:MAG: hypothetical protein K9J16_05115 [Melioribacteraceae bacterium]|nr:hypothetical protein [Melioribacteraceae bacterium]MCF8354225.1 hypothetical protein [Melioribacteraceae bacterium]MCF8392871.1 hypothetical protein [Melioribacteraceae bacterium]MCF8418643.1 hypothetical protein [Melioribacteraceae bacterium]
MPENEFDKIFIRLKSIFEKFENDLTVIGDNQKNYSLEGPYSEKFKKNLWFGAVQIKKNYVSCHLMPVYMYKDLADDVPKDLKKRMQGKSCFNFKKYDEDLFKKMEDFTDKCYTIFSNRMDKL